MKCSEGGGVCRVNFQSVQVHASSYHCQVNILINFSRPFTFPFSYTEYSFLDTRPLGDVLPCLLWLVWFLLKVAGENILCMNIGCTILGKQWVIITMDIIYLILMFSGTTTKIYNYTSTLLLRMTRVLVSKM